MPSLKWPFSSGGTQCHLTWSLCLRADSEERLRLPALFIQQIYRYFVQDVLLGAGAIPVNRKHTLASVSWDRYCLLTQITNYDCGEQEIAPL